MCTGSLPRTAERFVPNPRGSGAGLGAADSIVGPVSAPGSRSLELVLPAVPASVSDARRAVACLLDRLDVDLWAVQIVVTEAVANAVVHAYPDRAPGQVRLEAWLDDELLTVVVADDGVGLASGRGSDGLGEGLAVIRRLAREVEVDSRGGTRLVMRLQLRLLHKRSMVWESPTRVRESGRGGAFRRRAERASQGLVGDSHRAAAPREVCATATVRSGSPAVEARRL